MITIDQYTQSRKNWQWSSNKLLVVAIYTIITIVGNPRLISLWERKEAWSTVGFRRCIITHYIYAQHKSMKLKSTHPPTANPSVPHSFTNPDHSVLSVAWEMLSISLFCQLWIPFVVHWLVIMAHMGVITLNSRKPWSVSNSKCPHS